MEQVIAANYLANLEKCLEQFGVDNFIEKIGFDASRVQDPNAFLSIDEFKLIINQAYELSNCPQLGLLFGQSLSIVNHGFLGYAAMSSPNLGTAIHTVLSYLNTRTSLFTVGLQQVPELKMVYLELVPQTNDAQMSRFITELAITHLTKMRAFLLNCATPCSKIELAYEKPSYGDDYQELFQTEVVFNTKSSKLWVQAEELDFPLSFADDVSYQLAKTQLQEIVKTLTLEENLASKIKAILLKYNLHQISMEEIASELCMTSRTMRRHLQRQEITYQELLDEVREQKAKAFLLDNSISMTEISFLLGFHDTSNFSKAFKRWTGVTPSEYREQHGIH